MLSCPQIMLIGETTDVYKVIFWTKGKRGCQFELKAALNTNQFGRSDTNDFKHTQVLGPLVRLFNRAQARRILLTRPFQPRTGLDETTYEFVVGMLRD